MYNKLFNFTIGPYKINTIGKLLVNRHFNPIYIINFKMFNPWNRNISVINDRDVQNSFADIDENVGAEYS